MKKTIFLIMIAGICTISGCKQNSCAGVQTYPEFIPGLTNYFYKVGSYWVYRDSADGITDSQFVYSYLYREHYRNPDDTPKPLYQTTGVSGQLSSTYCGPYYLEDIKMRLYSYQNGFLKDSFSMYAYGANYNIISIWENPVPSQTSSAIELILGWTQTGLLNCCYNISPQGDTTGTWYNGMLPSVISGNYNFQNVSLWTVQIGDGSSPWFAHHTDLYVTSGSGIIKMVQHLPARDVKWDLINYHIVQ